MFVKERMAVNLETVTPDDSISKAFKILKENRYSQLPVVNENGILLGLVTEKLLTEVSPSKATSLSIFELNYLLSKTKVSEAMRKDIFTTNEDVLIEDAALIMKENDIGSLPVVEEGTNKLLGIMTRVDIFGAFIDLMGVNETGTRIVLKVVDKPGVFSEISTLITSLDFDITHMSNFKSELGAEIIVKVSSVDTDNLLKAFEDKGFEILSVIKK